MVALLRLRPDLAAPAPPDLATLATRLGVRTSLARALDTLDAFALRVLEVVDLLPEPGPQAVADGLSRAGDPRPTAADVDAALQRLYERALLWGDPQRPHLAGSLVDLLGPYPAGLGETAADLFASVPTPLVAMVVRAAGLEPRGQPEDGATIADRLADPETLAELLAECDPADTAVLDRLAAGPPAGRLSAADAEAMLAGDAVLAADADADARPAEDDRADSPAARLLRRGLLAPTGPASVELPREVGRALRGDRPYGTVAVTAPVALTVARAPEAVDATGSVAVLETLRLVGALAESWTREPAAQLRSGGLGVRDLRRTARELGVEENHTALLIEVAVAADLISAPMGRDVPWLPTTDYDSWAEREPAVRWVRLTQAWRTMTRQPHLIGSRDERGKARAALSYEIERAGAPGLRGDVLAVLLEAPPGATGPPEAVLERLAWTMPRRMAAARDGAAATLAEAEVLGITGGGGLTSTGRAVLTGAPARAVEALAAALPAEVSELLLQPDLTLVVPGPPTRELAREVSLVADLESAGGASVYRISDASLRRAFDAGLTATDLRSMLSRRSRTPMPQALSYLIDDLARRHGVLRTGEAGAYLRCDDAGLLDRVLGDRATSALRWHRLAPTVAVTDEEPARVLEVLRAAGYAPAAEDGQGSTVRLAEAPPRARPRRTESARSVPAAGVREEQLAESVRRMRRTDELARTAHPVSGGPDVPGVTSATTLGVLRQAIRADARVWVAYVDASGLRVAQIISPLSLGGGFLRGHDVESGAFRSIALHRITSVNVLGADRAI
ncbi:MAG: helicase-associated domain-containing protein [bacterium]